MVLVSFSAPNFGRPTNTLHVDVVVSTRVSKVFNLQKLQSFVLTPLGKLWPIEWVGSGLTWVFFSRNGGFFCFFLLKGGLFFSGYCGCFLVLCSLNFDFSVPSFLFFFRASYVQNKFRMLPDWLYVVWIKIQSRFEKCRSFIWHYLDKQTHYSVSNCTNKFC